MCYLKGPRPVMPINVSVETEGQPILCPLHATRDVGDVAAYEGGRSQGSVDVARLETEGLLPERRGVAL